MRTRGIMLIDENIASEKKKLTQAPVASWGTIMFRFFAIISFIMLGSDSTAKNELMFFAHMAARLSTVPAASTVIACTRPTVASFKVRAEVGFPILRILMVHSSGP